jgi:hypothetical protein
MFPMNGAASPVGYQSNASISMNAKQASANACKASDAAKDVDGHAKAATAHWNAASANRAAGNETTAKEHDNHARVHGDKAQHGSRARMFAQDTARDAEALSAKAGKAKHGADPDDPRSEKELHKDAADAHTRASKAFSMAGMKRDAAYHSAKAASHLKKAG